MNTKVQLPQTSPYTAKDQAKSDQATCFIGRGSTYSSTEAYRKAWGDRANKRHYTAQDVVFVSVEGARHFRVSIVGIAAELIWATDARARIVADKPADRLRPYNVGERELAAWLTDHGYREVQPGIWDSLRS